MKRRSPPLPPAGEGWGEELFKETRTKKGAAFAAPSHSARRCGRDAPAPDVPYCTVSVTSSSTNEVCSDPSSVPVNLITTVWPMYGVMLPVCTT